MLDQRRCIVRQIWKLWLDGAGYCTIIEAKRALCADNGFRNTTNCAIQLLAPAIFDFGSCLYGYTYGSLEEQAVIVKD